MRVMRDSIGRDEIERLLRDDAHGGTSVLTDVETRVAIAAEAKLRADRPGSCCNPVHVALRCGFRLSDTLADGDVGARDPRWVRWAAHEDRRILGQRVHLGLARALYARERVDATAYDDWLLASELVLPQRLRPYISTLSQAIDAQVHAEEWFLRAILGESLAAPANTPESVEDSGVFQVPEAARLFARTNTKR